MPACSLGSFSVSVHHSVTTYGQLLTIFCHVLYRSHLYRKHKHNEVEVPVTQPDHNSGNDENGDHCGTPSDMMSDTDDASDTIMPVK